MLVSLASESGRQDGQNEDWAGATSQVAVVLDGLSEGLETGCVHGTPWFVRELGSRLLALASDLHRTLMDALAQAITEVAGTHTNTCDLRHPGSPCTTVAMLRENEMRIEYLVLSDSMIVFDHPEGPQVITDSSVDSVANEETAAAYGVSMQDTSHFEKHQAVIAAQQRVRNRPGGYWVAQVDPEAAKHARVGAIPRKEVIAALVLSDGAARAVADFRKLGWHQLLKIAHDAGPAGVISLTRRLEAEDPMGLRWPRYKNSDDASGIMCEF